MKVWIPLDSSYGLLPGLRPPTSLLQVKLMTHNESTEITNLVTRILDLE